MRARLDELGDRRKALESADKELRDDTREILRKAKGIVSVAEASRRVRLNRSTVYELYLREGDEPDAGAVDEQPGTGERGAALAG